MPNRAKLVVKERNPVASVQEFLKALLKGGHVAAVLVAEHLPMKNAVMPTLVTDPEKLELADPLAPAFPLNAARVLSKLTRKPLDVPIAAVMRPCEIRAFIELVKLKQGTMENVLLIGMDCLGAFGNLDYATYTASGNSVQSTLDFYEARLVGKPAGTTGVDISPACKSCEYPMAAAADLNIGFLGGDMMESLVLLSNTEKGDEFLGKLGLPAGDEPAGRRQTLDALVRERTAYRDKMFEETSQATADVEKLMSYLGNCINCYNCRVACPVCYCKECVFVTDVFDHEPAQYLKWATRRGVLKMPTDTVFYHMTRLAHMSTACIGCGQCSNACPNNIPVMELFRTVAHATQRAFDYTPGMNPADEPPLSTFREMEFSEVTGGKD
jgi:formate dehydrogenase subunit beta